MSRRGAQSWIARGWLRVKRRSVSSCSNATSALHGDRFVFRDSAARRAAGGGIVVDPWPPERGRRRPERLVAIAALTEADPQQALLSHLSGDPGWVDLDRFALARGLAARVAVALWRPMNFRCVEASGTSFGFGWPKWQALAQAIGGPWRIIIKGARQPWPGTGPAASRPRHSPAGASLRRRRHGDGPGRYPSARGAVAQAAWSRHPTDRVR